jgi:hypothetical protein
MARSREVNDDAHSVLSTDSGLYLGEDDQRYLEALKDEDYVVTKNTRHPLGLFSVVAFILQQVIGQSSLPKLFAVLTRCERYWDLSYPLDCHACY